MVGTECRDIPFRDSIFGRNANHGGINRCSFGQGKAATACGGGAGTRSASAARSALRGSRPRESPAAGLVCMDFVNSTKLAAGWTMAFDRDGRELVIVAIKATFTIPPQGEEPELTDE